MRTGARALVCMVGTAVAIYPAAVFPDRPAFLYMGALAMLLTIVALMASSWIALVAAAVTGIIGYTAVLITERGPIDLLAPIFGVALVIFIEFFDMAVAATRHRTLERSAVVARLTDLGPGLALGSLAGVLTLFAGVYGGDGGVLLLALGAICIVVAYGVLTKVARSGTATGVERTER